MRTPLVLITLAACGGSAPAPRPPAPPPPQPEREIEAEPEPEVTEAEVAPVEDTRPLPEVKVVMGSVRALDEDTSLTGPIVAKKLKSTFLGHVRRCYQKSLRGGEQARWLVLAFAVDETGHVDEVTTDARHDHLEVCLQGKTKRWTFDVPMDSEGAPTTAHFTVKFRLTPVWLHEQDDQHDE